MTAELVIDETKLQSFAMKAIGDVGALMSAALVVIGDRLNLYRAMSASGPVTAAELATRTGTVERYVREWLLNQVASGYIDHDPESDRYSLPVEHALALTDESSPFFLAGAYQASLALVKSEARISDAFRTGRGLAWGKHDD